MATDNQERFYRMIVNFPAIASFWNQQEHFIDIEAFENALAVLSHGEVHLAKFFAAVWFGENRYGFDIFEAMRVLDVGNKQVIIFWLETPFYP